MNLAYGSQRNCQLSLSGLQITILTKIQRNYIILSTDAEIGEYDVLHYGHYYLQFPKLFVHRMGYEQIVSRINVRILSGIK